MTDARVVVAGLGNPGNEYEHTRHNAGFMFVDYLYSHAKEVIKPWKYDKYINADLAEINLSITAPSSKDKKSATCYMLHATLIKPRTFMNRSGFSIKKFATYYMLHATSLYVAHDDLDLRLGNFKIQMGTGPKMHNGISSIENSLNTKDFWRVRIGIDNRASEEQISGETYVLQKFRQEEYEELTIHFSSMTGRLLEVIKQITTV